MSHIPSFNFLKFFFILDDFLFVAFLKWACDYQLETFLYVCKRINFPVNMDKTFWSSKQIVFLGFLLDLCKQMISVPLEKLTEGKNMITHILERKSKKLTVLELQKLTGFLNFLGCAIIPGRAFTRRLYAHLGDNMKQHYHIRVSGEMRMDLQMWLKFLDHPSAFCRPFVDFSSESCEIVDFYTDASKSEKRGCGGKSGRNWYFQKWNPEFIRIKNPSIEFLELYGVAVGVLLLAEKFRNKRIYIFCDNKSARDMMNNNSSKCKNCMVLIRLIVLHQLIYNVHIKVKYVKSSENTLADHLSRMSIREFKRIAGDIDDMPTPIPSQIWPVEKIWID